jgi:pre-rRNA-processing protein TSR3
MRPPSRSHPLLLYLEVTGDDHPKACTGRRLLRRGLAHPVGPGHFPHPPPVVLDPYARDPLSADDARAAARGGLLAVDCSWNRLAARGGFAGDDRNPRAGPHRRLPILVAANPQHYGRVAELNTAEALSAALYLLGHESEAEQLMEGFRGGQGFLTINRARLAAYAGAADADGVRAVERALFGGDPEGRGADTTDRGRLIEEGGTSGLRSEGARSPHRATTRSGTRAAAAR